MQTLQTIQQFAPAVTAVSVLALPWATALVMHAASLVTRQQLDDKWNARAGAALRWAGTVAQPAGAQHDAVVQLPVPLPHAA